MPADRVTCRSVSRWEGGGRQLETICHMHGMYLRHRWLRLLQVRTKEQTRVCRSHHRAKHECTRHITGPNTSVQVRSQDQTRVCRSDHRTKHECTGHITGSNTTVQVRSQDQTRVYTSYHRTKHECTRHITGPNTSVQVISQDRTRVCRSDDRTKHQSAGQLICCQRGDGDEVMLNVLRCQLTY